MREGGSEHRASPALVARARRMGPLPWSALGPAPPAEVPLPASWLAAALDRGWRDLGRPDPLVVVDAGAGDGSRATAVLAAGPECTPALRWLLVDADPAAVGRQRAALQGAAPRLALEDPALVLGPVVAGADPDDAPTPASGIGPVVASLRGLPAGLDVAVVLAVGWLGALPADRFEWRGGRWWEVRLAAARGDDRVVELLVEAGDRLAATVGAAEGARVADPFAARRWLASARRLAGAGRVLAVDLFSPDRLPLHALGAAPRATWALPPLLAAEWGMRE